jgi:hypothetical protein
MRHRAIKQALMLGAQMCTMIGQRRQSDFVGRMKNEGFGLVQKAAWPLFEPGQNMRINRDGRG